MADSQFVDHGELVDELSGQCTSGLGAALDYDGHHAIIAAPAEGVRCGTGCDDARGSVYIVAHNHDLRSWLFLQRLEIPETPEGVFVRGFGAHVAIHGDSAFVSARLNGHEDAAADGRYLFIYRNTNDGWIFTQRFKTGWSSAALSDRIAVIGDEYALLDYSPGPDGECEQRFESNGDGCSSQRGAAYIYTKSSDGNWVLNETIWGPAGIDLANVLFNGQTRPNVGGFVPPKLGQSVDVVERTAVIAVPYNALSTGPNIGLGHPQTLFAAAGETRIYEIGDGPICRRDGSCVCVNESVNDSCALE